MKDNDSICITRDPFALFPLLALFEAPRQMKQKVAAVVAVLAGWEESPWRREDVTIGRIAMASGVCEKNVRITLQWLESNGWLTRRQVIGEASYITMHAHKREVA